MEMTHKLLNILHPPISFILLILFLPLYLTIKFLACIKRHVISENVAGKVIVVTGAASGIGEQIVYEYARRGASLVLVDLKDDRLGPVMDKARSLGSPDVIAVAADVSVVDDCKRFVDAAVNHFGKMDHLVNNAGIAHKGLFEKVDRISDLQPVMDINFWGSVYGTQLAIPHLKKSKGKIIVISSTCGWYPIPKLHIYNASKAALISFFETLRTEVGSDIGITIVTPGLIKSELTEGKDFPKKMQFIPMESKEDCGKAIVESACRGDKYLVEPSWVSVLFMWKALCPEVIEYGNRWVFITRSRISKRNNATTKQA